MTRVLIAPDKFKGSLDAGQVASHVAAGLRRVAPELEIDTVPMADGGEGTVEAALAAGYGPVTCSVTGPLGEPVDATYALRGPHAVIEMAAASGLAMTSADDHGARRSSSLGTGQLVRHAIDNGATHIVLGVGGSASTDGGAGLASALGARLLAADGTEIGGGGDALRSVSRVDLSGLDPRLAGVGVVLAADVANLLLGPDGAASVYGPQKGADERAVADLEHGLERWVDALTEAGTNAAEVAGQPGAGAAGGVGFAVMLLLNARRRPGVEVILELTGFAERVAGVDLVITGEGSLDEQSLFGKTPVGVAAAAARAGVRTVAVAGRSTLSRERLREFGIDACYALTDVESDVNRCMTEAGPILEDIAEVLARDYLELEGTDV